MWENPTERERYKHQPPIHTHRQKKRRWWENPRTCIGGMSFTHKKNNKDKEYERRVIQREANKRLNLGAP